MMNSSVFFTSLTLLVLIESCRGFTAGSFQGFISRQAKFLGKTDVHLPRMALESSIEVAVQLLPDAHQIVSTTVLADLSDSAPGFVKPEILESATDVLDTATEAVSDTIGAVTEKFDSATAAVSDTIEAVSDTIEAASEKFGAATAPVSEFVNKFSDIPSGVQSKIEAIKADFLSKVNVQVDTVKSGVDSKKNEVLGSVTTQFQEPISQFNEVSSQALQTKQTIDEQVTGILKTLEQVFPPDKVFLIDNAAALPVWFAMILFPNKLSVQLFMRSYIPVVFFSFIYVWAAYLSFQDPTSLEAFSSGAFDLPALTKGFSSETTVDVAWAHFIAQDLFIGRFIYLDGIKNKVFTGHSLLLTLLFGPAGVLSHLFTRGAARIFNSDIEDIIEAGRVPKAAEVDSTAAKAAADKIKGEAVAEAASLVEEAKKQALVIKEEAEKAIADEKENASKIKVDAAAEAKEILEAAKKEAELLELKGKVTGSKAKGGKGTKA